MASLALVSCAVTAVLACLPDLEVLPPRPPNPPSGGAFCGDGLIALAADGGGEACDLGEAGVVGCTRECRIECPDGRVDPASGHCYFPLARADDFETALSACSAANAHLVTFNSDQERRFVYERFTSQDQRFWVGLVQRFDAYTSARDRIEPGWAANCSGCFGHLAPDASDFVGDAGDCLADEPQSTSYTRVSCSVPLAVICEREPPGASIEPCAGGFCVVVPKTFGQKRYLFVPFAVPAAAAVAGCNALGGSLAIFDSTDEREAVIAEIQRIVTERRQAWVGLGRNAQGSFVWDDDAGENSRPLIWGRGEPALSISEARAAVTLLPLTGGTASEVDIQLARAIPLSEERPYICQYGPGL